MALLKELMQKENLRLLFEITGGAIFMCALFYSVMLIVFVFGG